MGRNNPKYRKTLHQQAHERLAGMLCPGESKQEDRKTGADRERIYSFKTYETYKIHVNYFCSWMKKEHPDITTLRKARKYVPEWLDQRANAKNSRGEFLSAWTLQTEAAALNKLFGINPADPERFQAPERHRADIKRSRSDVATDRHFSVKNNDELIKFCKGTGCRRNVLEKLQGTDYFPRERMEKEISILEDKASRSKLSPREEKDLKDLRDALQMFLLETDFVHHVRDKGGKSRYAPIIGPNKEQIIDRLKNTAPDKKVWQHVHSKADVHGYRADYVTSIYRKYAREIKGIPYDKVNAGSGKRYQGDVYICRADEKGKRLDKRAMRMASFAAGHNRISVIANNYLRGL